MKLKPLALALRTEPALHFHTVIGGEEYVLPLDREQARTLGCTLVLLADMVDQRDAKPTTKLPLDVVRSEPLKVN